ncbi:hypothetical protein DYB32_005643 [Aphanomyces invadans]|uniref:Uncharacterized protein n=1 Tax=Aphanomyces invadans TaxID=157072 RepID=A0A418ATZ6_9STRA|nr:hypothetical protein DYB32_005643 [Aphanomyces invadans]
MVYAWELTTLNLPSSMLVLWTAVQPERFSSHNASYSTLTAVKYAYVVDIRPTSWRLAKLLVRLLLCVLIARIAYTAYYIHVRHLVNQLKRLPLHGHALAVRYEIVVGEPTCLVLSHPIVCWLFVLDIAMSAEYVGLACLRVSQTSDVLHFALGMLYLSRTVWCAYTALTALNSIMSRFPRYMQWLPAPANTTLLALLSLVGGGGVVAVLAHNAPLIDSFTSIFSVVRACDATSQCTPSMDSSLAMSVYMVSCALLPFIVPVLRKMLGVVTGNTNLFAVRARVSSVASKMLSSRRMSSQRLGSGQALKSIEVFLTHP